MFSSGFHQRLSVDFQRSIEHTEGCLLIWYSIGRNSLTHWATIDFELSIKQLETSFLLSPSPCVSLLICYVNVSAVLLSITVVGWWVEDQNSRPCWSPTWMREVFAHLPYGSPRGNENTFYPFQTTHRKRRDGKCALIERIKLRERTRTRAVCLSSKPVQVRWMNNRKKTHEYAHHRIGCPRRRRSKSILRNSSEQHVSRIIRLEDDDEKNIGCRAVFLFVKHLFSLSHWCIQSNVLCFLSEIIMWLERCENDRRQWVQCQLNCLWSLDRNNLLTARCVRNIIDLSFFFFFCALYVYVCVLRISSTRMKSDSWRERQESLWWQVKQCNWHEQNSFMTSVHSSSSSCFLSLSRSLSALFSSSSTSIQSFRSNIVLNK